MQLKQDYSEIIIVYDGDCPFCSNYTQLLVLRKEFGYVKLINARKQKNSLYIDEIASMGLDLDEGMAVKIENKWYHGADCIYMLSHMNSNINTFNKLNRFIFKYRWLTSMLYPFMRFVRNITLFVLNRHKIKNK